jgi:hypothetical protein
MRKMTHVVVQSVMQEADGWKRVLRDAFKLRVSGAAWVNYNASSPFTPPRLIKTLIATTKIVRAPRAAAPHVWEFCFGSSLPSPGLFCLSVARLHQTHTMLRETERRTQISRIS